jgi:SAM-dependent methyltransferase
MLTIDFGLLGLQDGHVLVDIGCGEGRHTLSASLEHDATIIGVDLAGSDLTTASARLLDIASFAPRGTVTFVRGDALQLPLGDASVDRVVCSEVLEHVPNYLSVLAELYRILKPGGKLAVSVPRAWPERLCWLLAKEYAQTPGGHIRIFNRGDLRREIEIVGFQYDTGHGAHALHVPYWWLKCLFWQRGDDHPLVQRYHRFLVWDLMQKPPLTRWLDRLLNPIMGKSVVMYFTKPCAGASASGRP